MVIENVIGDYRQFVSDLLVRVQETPINIDKFPIDHCCYRTETYDEYQNMKKQSRGFSSAWVENIHHGRPISKFLLKEPLSIGKYHIPLIELPAPVENKPFPAGLEHLEFVVGEGFLNFCEQYKDLWSGGDDSGPFNKTVYIRFDNGRAIKFHERALLKVLELEGIRLTPIQPREL